jgi:hypothetical protein
MEGVLCEPFQQAYRRLTLVDGRHALVHLWSEGS